MAAPLSATYFSQLTNWSSHYLVSLSLAVSNIVILAGVFRFEAQDGTSPVWSDVKTVEKNFMFITECLQKAGEVVPNKTEEIHDNKFGDLMKNKTVHFLSLFIMVYAGVEVTIGGMI